MGKFYFILSTGDDTLVLHFKETDSNFMHRCFGKINRSQAVIWLNWPFLWKRKPTVCLPERRTLYKWISKQMEKIRMDECMKMNIFSSSIRY